MKALRKIINSRKYILFFDFEGTEKTQEIIAIGAVLCSINTKDCTIKKRKAPFKTYVKANGKVGTYVTKLTGITEELLEKQGVSFYDAMTEVKKYCGLAFKKTLFVSFSNSDLRFLNQTISRNLKWPQEICHQIQKNYFDFATFMSNYVLDENGNRMSLLKYCELYECKLAEPAHDPTVDSINLANLYDEFLKRSDITSKEYEKVIFHYKKLPTPILEVMEKLQKDGNVTIEDLREGIKKTFQ